MKRIVCLFVITVIIITCFAGCGKKENLMPGKKENWMPYELEFGMTYDATKELFKDMPELKDASANDGYLTKNYSLEKEEINGYFDFLKPAFFPSYAFSFNENKELYEFYCGNSYYYIQDNAEATTEELYNSFVDFYNEKTGITAKEKENADGLEAIWETEEVNIAVCVTKEEDHYIIYNVVHNNKYDFVD